MDDDIRKALMDLWMSVKQLNEAMMLLSQNQDRLHQRLMLQEACQALEETEDERSLQ